jgi:hypothetical protein
VRREVIRIECFTPSFTDLKHIFNPLQGTTIEIILVQSKGFPEERKLIEFSDPRIRSSTDLGLKEQISEVLKLLPLLYLLL